MNILSFFSKHSINWNQILVCPDTWTRLTYNHQITPWDFLSFANEDLKTRGIHGLINALSNAKRAIDCQADTALSALGYCPNNLHKQLDKSLIKHIDDLAINRNQPLTFRLLESLGIITPAIIGKMRSLRHLSEHHYKKPSKEKVCDAIDVAKLFIRATERMIFNFSESFGFGSGKTKTKIYDNPIKEYYFSFHSDPYYFECLFWNREEIKGKAHKSPCIKILPSEKLYFSLLRLSFALDDYPNLDRIFTDIVSSIGLTTKVKVVEIL